MVQEIQKWATENKGREIIWTDEAKFEEREPWALSCQAILRGRIIAKKHSTSFQKWLTIHHDLGLHYTKLKGATYLS
jgi:hypothetical protein